jgi:hypothetical protein
MDGCSKKVKLILTQEDECPATITPILRAEKNSGSASMRNQGNHDLGLRDLTRKKYTTASCYEIEKYPARYLSSSAHGTISVNG